MKLLLTAFLAVDAVTCAQATNNAEDATRPHNHLRSKADTHGLFRGEARAAVAETNRAGIINGHVAQPGEYPYAVSLQQDEWHFCGGSLIARDVVLTAAHCQSKRWQDGQYDQYDKVVLGRHDLHTQDGQAIEVATVKPHPDYNVDDLDNDFMLIYLKNPADISANVRIITPNSDPNEPTVNSAVNVMGWGDTDIDLDVYEGSDVLMEVDLDVVSNEDCIIAYESAIDITPNMLCAQDFANKQSGCHGDSGGPLVEGNSLVGVVSFGQECASETHHNVYARVSQAYEWIREQVCARSCHVPDWADCPARESSDSKCTDTAKDCAKIVHCMNGKSYANADFTGDTGKTCAEECGANCCIGTQACDNGRFSVCADDGEVNCDGDYSCAAVGGMGGTAGLISGGSCVGFNACKRAGSGGGTVGGTVGDISKGSCIGANACQSVGREGIAGDIDSCCVGKKSCRCFESEYAGCTNPTPLPEECAAFTSTPNSPVGQGEVLWYKQAQ